MTIFEELFGPLLIVMKKLFRHTIATWSSGTGMAGVVGAFSYAGLTDRHLLALSPTEAMIVMLVVPALFMITWVSTPFPDS